MPQEAGWQKEMIWQFVKAKLGLTSSDGLKRSGRIKTGGLADLRRLKASRSVVPVKEFLNQLPRPGNRLVRRKRLWLLKNVE
jgi:hypothetical protein